MTPRAELLIAVGSVLFSLAAVALALYVGVICGWRC